MAFETVIENGIAELVFCKPPVNAFNSEEWAAISRRLDELGQDSAVKVIVIRAEGKGFCAGVDIKELAADSNKIVAVNKGNYDTFKSIHLNPKPVIVALHGFVLGGGIGISGAADIIVASECARFGVPEVDRGAMGGGAHLQRMFPVQKVRYMYYTGDFIDAQEAYRLGAVERVVALARLREEAMAIAAKIAEKSSPMIQLAKEALTGIEDGSLEDKYRWEQGFTLEAYRIEDSQEARDAFVEKRGANFNDAQG
ncbi:MAG: enoyl-CoA hydratase [Pseudomonadales bacterium]|jgi:enoyl-CoA hydratase|uniref:enoyl-CoA hydratase family protein n=1 Tax=unclassified Ketobacter TaxID=2639109 RepID=UPI000C568C0E|nr:MULTISPECIES: enoyl-CoA hydratase family protein [unclassified Ketobacter]MAA59011.1 enoyl-CoA hydratase [Pseudomonadales bacterium]MEC8812348.1 enoyl-CoA hydratase family protein [Pseudomonadota bacterium]TNC83609.1 MAG: enoyl-CoA hydratase [Alcanivorax sp.]HAG96748.1 enoyl-CoA hydratase family protein [Gammaproteobacteria bacterium]MAQ26011.1 enoyl-CoA hydratase [Pseudomonadales bacterium]|tara:strand:+ start:578 stop:1339 length:762 start_codon:yes stop_codon:yes gene_type:complete